MSVMRLLLHLWLDTADARRALGADGLQKIEAHVRDSEARHTGEICVCLEAALPLRSLWLHLRHGEALANLVRERAIELFGTQRVWDTEGNNGVLIYLQLAEHRIEIVADRGVARYVDQTYWHSSLADVTTALRTGRLEDGLRRAIDVVDAVLQRHFPASGTQADAGADRGDELPDRPLIL